MAEELALRLEDASEELPEARMLGRLLGPGESELSGALACLSGKLVIDLRLTDRGRDKVVATASVACEENSDGLEQAARALVKTLSRKLPRARSA